VKSYFKLAQIRPVSPTVDIGLPRPAPPSLFYFETTDAGSCRRAWIAMSESRRAKRTPHRLSAWRLPDAHGPWSELEEIAPARESARAGAAA